VAHFFVFFLDSWLLFFRNANWFYSGFETLLLGGACAIVAFTLGYYIDGLLGHDDDALP
jgi:DNA damage-binding protein 1